MNYSLIEKCRGCHAPESDLQEVLQMDPMPLAGMFCETREEALKAPIFPLTWMHCSRCGLVQVREDVADQSLFTRYNYASSTVPGLVRHFVSYAEFLAKRYSAEECVRFLEVGCNDGVLLSRLPAEWQLIGFDPSDVAERAARNSTYRHYPLPFNLSSVAGNGLEGSVDVISGSNCLAHISDLKGVFEAAWVALRPGGHIWIEVHDLAALLQGAQWDTIYHEHKVEWSEQSLIHCLTPVGFRHRETLRTPMHGGALRICFEKAEKESSSARPSIKPEAGLKELRIAYDRRYETEAAHELLTTLNRGGKIGAYGASGRANVYLNQLPRLRFEYIIDEAPLRMNKFIPRAGTPILGPAALEQNPVEACLVTAWNYRDDIVRKNPQHKGSWLTAFEAS